MTLIIDLDLPRLTVPDLLDQLQKGLEGVTDQYREYLQTLAKFHKYSLGNIMLIEIQQRGEGRGEATYVAGLNRWKDLGRSVKKGEKGMAILAPCMPKKPPPPEEGEEPEPERRPVYFRTVYVFDAAQTDGEPLPAKPEWGMVEGTTSAQLMAALVDYTGSRGLQIKTGPELSPGGTTRGYYHHDGKYIWLDTTLPVDQITAVLAHELGHFSFGHHGGDEYQRHRGDHETQAESFAYVVTWHFGLDISEASFFYLNNWAISQDKVEESTKRLKQHLQTIKDTVSPVLVALEAWDGWGVDVVPEVTEPEVVEPEPVEPEPEEVERPLQPALFQEEVEALVEDALRSGSAGGIW